MDGIKVIKKLDVYYAHREMLPPDVDKGIAEFRGFEAIAKVYIQKTRNPIARDIFEDVLNNLQKALQESV